MEENVGAATHWTRALKTSPIPEIVRCHALELQMSFVAMETDWTFITAEPERHRSLRLASPAQRPRLRQA